MPGYPGGAVRRRRAGYDPAPSGRRGQSDPRRGSERLSDQGQQLSTDQAEREASGAHAYGRYLEEFEVGAVYEHWPAKTVTEADDHLFCLITMNHHPLHLNDVYAAESQQGRNVVVGPLVYSLALGMSVSDVSGKAIANLATEELSHPNPVFHGDTLYCESEVLDVRPSSSKPDRGVVRVHTRVYKQDGTLVAEFKRAVLVPRRDPDQGAGGQLAEAGSAGGAGAAPVASCTSASAAASTVIAPSESSHSLIPVVGVDQAMEEDRLGVAAGEDLVDLGRALRLALDAELDRRQPRLGDPDRAPVGDLLDPLEVLAQAPHGAFDAAALARIEVDPDLDARVERRCRRPAGTGARHRRPARARRRSRSGSD